MIDIRHIIIAALLVLVSASPALAQDAPSVTDFTENDVRTVQLLLSGYHDLADREAFDRIDDAPEIVEALARDSRGVVRDRALAALGRYWPSGDVYLLYAQVLSDPATREGTQHRVMLLFADAFGDRALRVIEPFLANESAQIQLTAVQALARIGTDEALSLIDAYAASTTDPVILEQVAKYGRALR